MNAIKYQAPSNIALVKYWGKFGNQMPLNPSISFTLNRCKTITEIKLEEKKQSGIEIELYFEGNRNPTFEQKIVRFLDSISTYNKIAINHKLIIHSENTFPHSSGIASSAASMAALSMCLCALENPEIDLELASTIARIGSGSACRSIFPKLGLWGKNNFIPNSSNEYAIPFADDVDEVLHTFQNSILIASSTEKSVSSRAGHELMNQNRFAPERIKQANQNMIDLCGAMREGDLECFGRIVEEEALTLHALMMTSSPSFILMKPSTLTMIEKIRNYRQDTGEHVYFTLDAGPNIHLLYPKDIKNKISDFIQSDLKPLCENGLIIEDEIGNGPTAI